MAIAIKHVREYYMDRIDDKNFSVVENVHRYIDLIQMFRGMQKVLRDEGPTVVIKNGKQEFTKAHPLINDIKNINAQLINLKKELDRHVKEYGRNRTKKDIDLDITNDELI